MSYSNGQRSPGRPRDTDREQAILAIVRELLAEEGYDKVTFELVARRASASKPTLYRRWATKRDMVVAAARATPATGTGTTVDTGSLRGDLLALLDILAATLTDSDPTLVATLLQASLADAHLCEHLEQMHGPTGARLPHYVLRASIDRGELPTTATPFAYDEVVGSTLITRALNGLTYDDGYRRQLVDLVIIPALRTPATDHLYAGIFAGRTSKELP